MCKKYKYQNDRIIVMTRKLRAFFCGHSVVKLLKSTFDIEHQNFLTQPKSVTPAISAFYTLISSLLKK